MKEKQYNSFTDVTIIPFSEIEKIDFALCEQPRQRLQDFYNNCEIKPDVLTNGGFFGMSDGSTCFNYKDEGQDIHCTNQYKWGMGIIDKKTIAYGSIDSRTDWRDFISGYPVLIDNYEAIKIDFAKELNYKARRTVLAFTSEELFLITIDLPGMNYKQMQEMLKFYNVQYAINLDGGGSTRKMVKGKTVTNGIENRAVDNVVAVYLKKAVETPNAEEKIIYRVQVGAYSKKENAEVMLEKIKALGDIYEKAYIRQVDGLFKCQTGAFAIKTNAERIQQDLKSKGFNSFITIK